MKKPANDILDTCKYNTAKFSEFVVSKLIKKNCLHYYASACLVSILFLFTSFDPDLLHPYGLTKVVIDAGHGGHDPGCLGKKSKEKDLFANHGNGRWSSTDATWFKTSAHESWDGHTSKYEPSTGSPC